MDIFVGNLSFDAIEADVKRLFEGFGNVASVVIVMRKEKKLPKSRGFGFVQMPDDQQALAAIAALGGQEFMGRALNVNPARTKIETHREVGFRRKMQHPALTDRRVRTSLRPGTYKGGRRTHSYMKRHGLTEMQQEPKPRSRSQDNPMRWRKRRDQSRPRQKNPDEQKPWQKAEGESKPRHKSEGGGHRKPGGYKR